MLYNASRSSNSARHLAWFFSLTGRFTLSMPAITMNMNATGASYSALQRDQTGGLRRISPTQHASTDFTARYEFCARPQLADTQSDPALNSLSPTPGLRSIVKGRRRVSEPLQSRQTRPSEDSQSPLCSKRQRRADDQESFPDHSDNLHDHNSVPSASGSSKTARSVHEDLRSKITETLTPSDTQGVVYILCDPKRRHLGFKIGSTTRATYDARIKEHERGCEFKPEVVHVSQHEVQFCLRVEKLAQTDLSDHCKPWPCKHKGTNTMSGYTMHGEWFIVSKEMAIQTVKRWENFMIWESPYTWDGQLTHVWTYLLTKRQLTFSTLDSTPDAHNARRMQWNTVLAPPATGDYVQAYWQSIVGKAKEVRAIVSGYLQHMQTFFWQLISLLYGMVTLVICRNTVAISAFFVVLLCAGVSVQPHFKQVTPKQGTPKKRSRK